VGIEIGEHVFDRGDIGLRRLVFHCRPGRIDAVISVGQAVEFADERLDLRRAARRAGRDHPVRYDRSQHPRPTGAQPLQELDDGVGSVIVLPAMLAPDDTHPLGVLA
jgi:hypothetical protein